ncbi:MAG: hypothetical protein LBF40_02520 [Deltaproteobacteria bacterium]|jgi:hypothetical protein|nr:hypothetical protein [Deltaproteobacteria bacterium]
MIASSIPGRLRLRGEGLKDPSIALGGIRSLKGVNQVEHNPRTGSVLILYDPGTLDPDEAGALLSALDPELSGPVIAPEPAQDPDKGPSNGNRTMTETVGMGIALASVLVSGLLRKKKLHFMAGMFLVEMIGEHLWRFRHRLKGKFDLLGLLGVRRFMDGQQHGVHYPEDAPREVPAVRLIDGKGDNPGPANAGPEPQEGKKDATEKEGDPPGQPE